MKYPKLLEYILSRENMLRAYSRVRSNDGAAGVDGMTVKELPEYLRSNWERIRQSLLDGSYQPIPVRGVEIPKPNGGVRLLGIPTVLDRLIQQAIYQVLSPIWEPDFSPNSYGFRPYRRAQHALGQALKYINAGRQDV